MTRSTTAARRGCCRPPSCPRCAAGNYAEGIEAGIVSARERLITPFLAGTPVSVTDGFETPDGGSGLLTGLLGAGAVVGVAGFAIWRNRRARRTCPNCGGLTLDRTREVIQPPTAAVTRRRDAAPDLLNLRVQRPQVLSHRLFQPEGRESRSSLRSGSGDHRVTVGGFGGGRSSGGGASGKW
jgi:uncharacterized protein